MHPCQDSDEEIDNSLTASNKLEPAAYLSIKTGNNWPGCVQESQNPSTNSVLVFDQTKLIQLVNQ